MLRQNEHFVNLISIQLTSRFLLDFIRKHKLRRMTFVSFYLASNLFSRQCPNKWLIGSLFIFYFYESYIFHPHFRKTFLYSKWNSDTLTIFYQKYMASIMFNHFTRKIRLTFSDKVKVKWWKVFFQVKVFL